MSDLGDALAATAKLLAERNRYREALREVLEGAQMVLDGFESGVFCRNTDGDGASDWAIKAFKPLRGLAILQQAIDAALGDAR